MMRGVGNVLFSTYSQTFHGQDPLFTFGGPLLQVQTFFFSFLCPSRSHASRVQIEHASVSTLNNVSVCAGKTSTCVGTCGRFVSTHGCVLDLHEGFSACQTTTQHNTKHKTNNNTYNIQNIKHKTQDTNYNTQNTHTKTRNTTTT